MVDYTSHIPSRGRGSSLEFGLALWIILVDRTWRNTYLVSFWPSSFQNCQLLITPSWKPPSLVPATTEEAKTGPLDQRPCRESLKEERRPSWTLVLPAEIDSMNVPSQHPMEGRWDFPTKVCPDWKSWANIWWYFKLFNLGVTCYAGKDGWNR